MFPVSRLLPAVLFSALCLVFTACAPRSGETKSATPAAAPGRFELRNGDRVVFLGDTFAERAQYDGWIELMLTTRFADRDVTFRNLGWSADTPAGASRLGRSLLQAGHEPADEPWKMLVKQLEETKPTVVLLAYGMADSFAGADGLPAFKTAYGRLLDELARISPGVRVVLLGPVPHENLGAPWPNPDAHNAQLALYARAVGEIAAARGASYIPLFDLLPAARGSRHLTDNGIHLTPSGYRVAAEVIEDQLLGSPGAWRTSAETEKLREAIIAKNEWFFYRSRPSNMAYIFGFRRKEQGNNAAEIPQFDELILAEEKRIAQLRPLRAIDVPPVPLRRGNKNAAPVVQPRPEFEVADGFEVTLWAENPLLDKPVQINFDAQGRLWVACTPVYPQIEPGQMATDKIVILEDTRGAGAADKVTVFADNLLLPLGIEPGDGGAYVAQSTDLLFLRDTDGDGKADERRFVLSGFGTEDTHHNLHTLRWGPDGRLYLNQSVYTRTDTETPHGIVRLRAGGVFRLDPRDQKLEILYRGWVNTWGHQFDAYGQSFFTDGAGNRGISWGVLGATYQTLAPARREIESISPGSYPKFCGLEIVHSELFPADWQGDIITGDFRANRVVRFKLASQGSGYVTRQMPDLLRTTADSFRPVDMKLGPDGALYIADWSNRIIQHGEVDFRDPRRDKVHGRIWRVAPRARSPLPKFDFANATNAALLDQLVSPNLFNQERARRVLFERGADRVLPELSAWTARQTAETALLQAAWLYAGFNRPQPALLARLLAATDADVRAAAVRLLPPDSPEALAQLGRLVADAHPRVRLEAVRALAHHPSVAALDLALSVLDRPMDNFLDYALWLTVNDLSAPWIAAVKGGQTNFAGRDTQLAFVLKALPADQTGEVLGLLLAGQPLPRDGSGPWIELIGRAGTPAELQQLFAQVAAGGLDRPAALRALGALGEAARLRKLRPAGALDALGGLLGSADAELRRAAIPLAGLWAAESFAPKLLELAATSGLPDSERSAVLNALRDIGGETARNGLRRLAETSPEAATRREAVVALASLDLNSALPAMLAALQAAPAEEAPNLWRALLGVNGASALLAKELSKSPLPAPVALAGVRPAREGTQHQSLVQVLMPMAGLALPHTALTPAELQAFAAEALAKGDAARGEQVYRRVELACMACHAIGGVGGKVGPDLTSIGASAQPDYLVEALINPAAKVKEGYHSVLITTKSQQAFSGIIVRENATEVLLRDAANQEVSIPVSDIVERTGIGSLMPAGLIDGLLPEERLDLIKFLAALGKPGDFDAAKRDTARFWRLYQVTSRNTHLGTERVTRGDLTLADWVPTATLVSGVLPPDVLAGVYSEHDRARGFFVATRFQAAKAGPVTFELSGGADAAWLNGQEIRPGERFTVTVPAGAGILVLRLGQNGPPAALRLRSGEVTFLPD